MAVTEAAEEAEATTGTHAEMTIVVETIIDVALGPQRTTDTIDLDHVARRMIDENDPNADAPQARRKR